MVKTLNVIGCGRVGQTLGRLWQAEGSFAVQDLHGRTADKLAQAAVFMGGGRPVAELAAMRAADAWMLTVPDTQIAAVAAQLAQVVPLADATKPPVVFHCSGFLGADALAPLRERGWLLASAHPLLNFASPQTGVAQFAGTPCGLEGDAAAVQLLADALLAIGGKNFDVVSEMKPLYHAAAVFSSNFTVVLQGLAQEAWRAAGVPEALLPGLNAALLQNTVDNLLALGPAKALTGPAARGDTAVVQIQGAAVARWSPSAGEAYRTLSALAVRLAQSGTAH